MSERCAITSSEQNRSAGNTLFTAPRETSREAGQSSQNVIDRVLRLQRTLGNQRVAHLIQTKQLTPDGRIAGIHRKLTVGAAGDQFEKEADRVAHQVLNTSDSAVDSMQRETFPETDKDKRPQTLAASVSPFASIQGKGGPDSGSFEAGAGVESQLSQSKGNGSPLPDHVRNFMEPRFGADFSQVRVHTGTNALQMNQAVGAHAFTHGSDIYYGAGNSPGDLELTAHELTHVVQQGGAVHAKLAEGSSSLQRDDAPTATAPAPTTAVTTTTPSTPATTTSPTTATTPGAPTGAPLKTTPLKIKAKYEYVPGASKTGPEKSKGNNALWFSPLTIGAMSPSGDEVSKSIGVTVGGGQLVETYKAPLYDNPAEGTGMITAQLKYAKDVSKSYTVKVSGLKGKSATDAQIEAKKFVADRISTFGDFEEIQKQATAHMMEKFPGSQVEVAVSNDRHALADAGRSSFFYKARNNPSILLDVPVVTVAEKTIQSGGSTVKTDGVEKKDEQHNESEKEKIDSKNKKTEDESHHESSEEKTKVEYSKAAVKTLEEFITSVNTTHNTLKSQLAQKTASEFKYHDDYNWEEHKVEGHFNDYTKNVKGYNEEGDKDKKNWAAWLQDGIDVVQDITEIPFLSTIPGIGKLARKVKGWGIVLDVVDKVAGKFAERGKVKYKDSKEDTTVKEKGGSTDDTKGSASKDGSGSGTTTSTSDLEQSFDSTTNTAWNKKMKKVTDIKENYSSVTQKSSSGGSTKVSTDDSTYDKDKQTSGGSSSVKQNQSMVTSLEYHVTAKESYTQPVLKADIVDGDGEVSATPFPPIKPFPAEPNRTTP